MNRQDILLKLEVIFQDVFDDDSIALNEQMTSSSIEGWDSLSQISILSAVADEFDLQLAISDTRNLKNIGALVDLIEQKMKS